MNEQLLLPYEILHATIDAMSKSIKDTIIYISIFIVHLGCFAFISFANSWSDKTDTDRALDVTLQIGTWAFAFLTLGRIARIWVTREIKILDILISYYWQLALILLLLLILAS